jgi:DNA adenine methylase
MVTASPIVKWAGGKSNLLPELLARVPAKFGRYFEPFAGGAAMFFALAPERSVLGDINGDLIATYEAIKADPDPVISQLHRHAQAHSADHYYRMRDRWNGERARWSRTSVASAFIYLNKAGFNGLYRVNRKGAFNVPYGRNPKTSICKPDVLRAAHAALANAELRAGDYRATLDLAERNDFAYLDSPHVPRSKTASFTAYSVDSFGGDAQHQLADAARELVKRGVHVVLSNADTPFVRELYKGFAMDRVKCPRLINSNTTKRGDVDELIIVGKPSPPRRDAVAR